MSVKKQIKTTDPVKRKKSLLVISVLGIVIAFFIIWKYFLNSDELTNQNPVAKNMNNETAYSFRKGGELSFLSKDEKTISVIDIEIAETEETRELGLMYRSTMEEKQGMLFIFQKEAEVGFWMKNTILSLDILFVNSKREIIKIHKNTVPYRESPGYESGKPALYVIEVNAGYCDTHKIKEGDKISYTRL